MTTNMVRLCRLRHIASMLRILALSTCLCIIGMVYFSKKTCSTSDSTEFISELCSLYKAKQLTGNMCNELCEKDVFEYNMCGNNRYNKKVIFLNCQGFNGDPDVKRMVMKSDLSTEKYLSKIAEFFPNENEPLQNMIRRTMNKTMEHLSKYFGRGLVNPYGESKSRLANNLRAFIREKLTNCEDKQSVYNFFGLAMQTEYVSMALLEGTYTPKLFGTCGHAYFVENTPSAPVTNYILFQGKTPELKKSLMNIFVQPSWKKRAGIAMQLINILLNVEQEHNKTLHFCDIVPRNIGIKSNGDVSLLDTDCIRTDGTFELDVGSKSCDTDKECQFVKCDLQCNRQTRTCTNHRMNNNFQNLCENVFLSKVEKFGLLRYPPSSISGRLREALLDCAYPETSFKDGYIYRRAPIESLYRVKALLFEGLNSK